MSHSNECLLQHVWNFSSNFHLPNRRSDDNAMTIISTYPFTQSSNRSVALKPMMV